MGKRDLLIPPVDADLLGLYCDLVDEYDRLGEAFPVSTTSFDLASDSPLGSRERWHRIVRAMALRKFVLGANDHVRADKTLAALKRCLSDPEDLRVLDRWQSDFDAIGTRVQVDEAGDAKRSLADLLKDLIYGSYLHGDLERWNRTQTRWRGSVDLALWMFSEDAEHYIRRLRSVIRLAASEGRLTPEATACVLSSTNDRMKDESHG